MNTDRRTFLATGSAFAALLASGCVTRQSALTGATSASPYGELRADPAGLLDLPEGFSYHMISRFGDAMHDGGTVPDRADGMGCFDLGGGKLALVRELRARALAAQSKLLSTAPISAPSLCSRKPPPSALQRPRQSRCPLLHLRHLSLWPPICAPS